MSIAKHHAEWLSLIEISGPFLSLTALGRVFPNELDTVEPTQAAELRSAYEEWLADSDDLAMMYQGTYPLTYYKILQRYVHSLYRIQRGLNRMKDFVKRPNLYISDFKKIASMLYHIPVSLLHSYRLKRLSSAHG